jgi:hypothetical protein
MNIEALKEWGRILLLIGMYMGGFLVLLTFILWIKTLMD